jgi:DNA-directed RNA polymerase subunit RPC12/RpoP|tara:strand:- start:341 stop:1837 length:1497 start_codon:yes stop_codon:yes gene_type:complete
MGLKEERIEKLTSLYYSNPEVQKAIFEFSKNREISARYFEAFGKRPDSFQYIDDFFALVKKGATSFHCSEELWENPLKISTDLSKEELSELRIGWDLLIDIDCKWFEYSKLAAKAIIEVFKKNGLRNVGLKFSGSKGFHILVPWKAFPKEIGGELTKNLFPELPRKVISYVRFEAEKEMKKILPEDFYEQFKDVEINRGIKCNKCSEVAREYEWAEFVCSKCERKEERRLEVGSKREFRCPRCGPKLDKREVSPFYECAKCSINSKQNPENFSKSLEIDLFDLMGLDLILVSPRHLFRMPYSLHEKTALASVVLNSENVSEFQPKDADPLKVKVRNFMPDCEEGEANELLLQALDWNVENKSEVSDEEKEKKKFDFEPVKIENLSDKMFSPSIQKILEGVSDGRKRALFVLLNLFRSLGQEKEEIERRIYDWNKKNKLPLKDGYIKAQFAWAYRNKVIPPPNFDKDYYKGIGVLPTEEELRFKNPVNYILKKGLKSGA